MFRDLTEEDNTASQIALRNCSEEVEEKPIYIYKYDLGREDWEIHVVKHEKMTANHKEETSHNFSAFLCLEDGAIWGP